LILLDTSVVSELMKEAALADAQIAALALDEQAIVATRNVKDFEPSGAELVNPWERAHDVSDNCSWRLIRSGCILQEWRQ
jgi:predicted nucleic acid-binding protein